MPITEVKGPEVGDLITVDTRFGLHGVVTEIEPEQMIGVVQMVDTVYLLHFEQPYPRGHRPQHYLGHATAGRLALRLAEHAKGSSKARMTQVFAELGIPFVVARTWSGDYELEKQLKRRHRPVALCPICKEASNASPG